MNKMFICAVSFLLVCVGLLTACDPVLPAGNISADYAPKPLPQGTTAEIELSYPDTTDTAVVGWNDPTVTIVSGEDVVKVSGRSITGLKTGTAVLRVEVKANCSFLGFIIDKPIFTTELHVDVK